MPRPRALTRAQITAALAVLDRDGHAALSMRAVAGRLGTSTMALYRYLDDRAALEALMVERVLDAIDPVPPADGPWPRRVTTMAERLRAAVSAHPEIVPLTLAHRHTSSGLLGWSRTVLGILADAGLTEPERAIALRGLPAFVIGTIHMDHLGPQLDPQSTAVAPPSPEEFRRRSAPAAARPVSVKPRPPWTAGFSAGTVRSIGLAAFLTCDAVNPRRSRSTSRRRSRRRSSPGAASARAPCERTPDGNVGHDR
ncbi:TetR/AcrR family transcriptional regulator [Actinomadura kijaniata]|uniref:TetR/AcrR family transcriptional regulator n=1 Tax=Actinomadura kijaniata TaxID=46161 RepID=UPI000833A37F|nr:TetR/AcrR family transcriptional regulator C-terminal domain-containing protein [Actinomadura kijaniata]